MKKPPLLKEIQTIKDKMEKEYDLRRKNTARLETLMEKEIEKSKTLPRANWFGITDYKHAHSNSDNFKCKKIVPCPFCIGEKSVLIFDEDSPAYGYLAAIECRVCKGTGEAWFKYGRFDIERDDGSIC